MPQAPPPRTVPSPPRSAARPLRPLHGVCSSRGDARPTPAPRPSTLSRTTSGPFRSANSGSVRSTTPTTSSDSSVILPWVRTDCCIRLNGVRDRSAAGPRRANPPATSEDWARVPVNSSSRPAWASSATPCGSGIWTPIASATSTWTERFSGRCRPRWNSAAPVERLRALGRRCATEPLSAPPRCGRTRLRPARSRSRRMRTWTRTAPSCRASGPCPSSPTTSSRS